MRFFSAALLSAMAASSKAFAPISVPKKAAVGPLRTSETHIDKGFGADSGMNVNSIPSIIDHLAPDNFDESLEMMEPLFLNELVGKEYDEYMDLLKGKCDEIGKEVPKDFAPTHH